MTNRGSAAGAIAWEFRRRHRWGFIAIIAYLAFLVVFKLWSIRAGRVYMLGDALNFALVVVVPLGWVITYFLAVFCYGLTGDLAARQSTYPTRMFTLPMTSAELAGWPMLYGTATMVVFWAALRTFGVWPADFDVPVVWPALLAAALVAWTQALTWMPYGLPGMRVGVAMFCLTLLDTIVLLALHFKTREPVMIAMLAPLVPLAYLVARSAVARARRGEVPDWRGTFARGVVSAEASGRARAPFASAARAQLWFEWHRHGRSLPILVAIVLPFELLLLFAAGQAAALVITILLCVFLTPPFLATFVAATVRKASSNLSDAYGVTPFIAARPLTSAALIAAKLKMTVLSTIVTWLLIVVAVPIALVWSDTWQVVSGKWRALAGIIGAPRTTALGVLVLTLFVATTWRQLVQSLYVGLSGREWLVKSSGFIALVLLCLVAPLAIWVVETPGAIAALWNAFPFIVAVLAVLKMSVAAWIAVRLWRTRVLSDRTLIRGAAYWLIAVLAVYGVLVWIFLTPHIPRYLFALVAILAIPLARLAASPLALAWNRHR